MSNLKIVENCIAFLERVQLQGAEVPALVEVRNWLFLERQKFNQVVTDVPVSVEPVQDTPKKSKK